MKKQVFNPYLPSWEYVPDGEPRVFGDRLYIYGSHDLFNGKDFCLNDYVLWSAPLDDLSDWRNEGVIYRAAQDPKNPKGNMHLCAPDCVQGPDGRYYLYYQLHMLMCTSVAVADNPCGPFEFYGYVQHPDGTPWGLQKGDTFAFDPGILVDEGRVWCYVGFSPTGLFKKIFQMRGNKVDGAVCLELMQDMKTVKGGENLVIPGHDISEGTGFEGHAFFEASSPRKIGDKYYFVYSSELSHELCYAVSDRPDGGFRYGGTVISIGDVGYQGRIQPDNYTGNTHGGLVQVNGQWYIFYHRQTNKQKCCRQGCAEKITILPDGSIPQVEMTSCGLNEGPLNGKGRYEARIACTLQSAEGTFPYLKPYEKDKGGAHPYFTQTGGDREQSGDQYIANMTNRSQAGFKYFTFNNLSEIAVDLRGEGEGWFCVSTEPRKHAVAKIKVTPSVEWDCLEVKLDKPLSGKYPLYFTFLGKGAVDFSGFVLG